jgi:hypothetical protein
MSLRLTRQFRRTGGTIGLLMALLALVSHFALAAMVVPGTTDSVLVAEADALTILCNHALPHQQHDRAPPSGRDCVLCPLSVSAALHAVIVGAAPALPSPVTLLAGRVAALPPARAPPLPALVAPYPTGPPTLV